MPEPGLPPTEYRQKVAGSVLGVSLGRAEYTKACSTARSGQSVLRFVFLAATSRAGAVHAALSTHSLAIAVVQTAMHQCIFQSASGGSRCPLLAEFCPEHLCWSRPVLCDLRRATSSSVSDLARQQGYQHPLVHHAAAHPPQCCSRQAHACRAQKRRDIQWAPLRL